MIKARKALVRHAIAFFETELIGLYRWGTGTVTEPPEDNTERDDEKPLRDHVFGKHREVLVVNFGPWRLKLESPTEHPPVGYATLEADNLRLFGGAIDQSTWKEMGEIVRSKESSNECKPVIQRPVADPIPGWGSAGPA